MCLCVQELEKQAEQELMALQKQKKMLTELLEKQKQVTDMSSSGVPRAGD